MKFFTTLATFALLALCCQALQFVDQPSLQQRAYLFAHHVQLHISKWMPSSRRADVSLFVSDIHHSKITEYIDRLQRRTDPMVDLCITSSAFKNGSDDKNTVPADLFHELRINDRHDVGRWGWKNMMDRLNEIRLCPAALQQVTYLHMYVYEYSMQDPPAEVIELLADVLSAMPNLEKLDWHLPDDNSQWIAGILKRRNLQLPSVTHLVGAGSEYYMIPLCPNLQRVESMRNNFQLLLQEASRVPSITSFSFGQQMQTRWNHKMTRDILQAIPNITHLVMLGEISPAKSEFEWNIPPLKNFQTMTQEEVVRHFSSITYDEEYDDDDNWWEPETQHLNWTLQELKSALNLTHLELPSCWELDLGFDGGGGCGNMYGGPEGREYGRRVAQKNAETIEKAANIAFSALPQLESVKIGSRSPLNVTRDANGAVVGFTWEWTDRMQEYLYEVWPEPEKGSKYYYGL